MFRARYLCHGCKVRMRNVQVQQSLTLSRENGHLDLASKGQEEVIT